MEKEVHVNKNSNRYLGLLLPELYRRGSKIKIKFPFRGKLKLTASRCDSEELSFFFLGLLKESYKNADKSKLYLEAMREAFKNFIEDIDKDLK